MLTAPSGAQDARAQEPSVGVPPVSKLPARDTPNSGRALSTRAGASRFNSPGAKHGGVAEAAGTNQRPGIPQRKVKGLLMYGSEAIPFVL
jgi:hypothetical protein